MIKPNFYNMKNLLLYLSCFLIYNFSSAQDTLNELQTAFIEKYNIDPYVTYHFDSNDLTSVYIPFKGKEGWYFVDYYGERKNNQAYEDIKLVETGPYFWARKEGKYYLHKFPANLFLDMGFDYPWTFGGFGFKGTYFVGPRGRDNEKIVFTETNITNINPASRAYLISSPSNFDKEFDINSQDLYPLISLEEDSLTTVVAINGDKIYECIDCKIAGVSNQKRFIMVKQGEGDYRIFDVLKRIFLEGEYNLVNGSSESPHLFYAFEEVPERRVTFFNSEGIKTFQTDYETMRRVTDDIYYISKKEEYQFANISTGEILSTSDSPIQSRVVNGKLYVYDAERDSYYDPLNTELEVINSMVTGEQTEVRVGKKKELNINAGNFMTYEGIKYYISRSKDYKYGLLRSDTTWAVEPKYKSISKLGDTGMYVAQLKEEDVVKYALLKFPEEVIYPFEGRKLSVERKYPFDLYYLIIEDFNSKIGINASFQVVYDPNKLFAFDFDRDLDWDGNEVPPYKNLKENEVLLPYIVLGNISSGFVFDIEGNYLYRLKGNVTNLTSKFGFEDYMKYRNVPVLPLGEFIDWDSQKTDILYRLEDGFIFREN